MKRNRCNILWDVEGIRTKNGGKTNASCTSNNIKRKFKLPESGKIRMHSWKKSIHIIK